MMTALHMAGGTAPGAHGSPPATGNPFAPSALEGARRPPPPPPLSPFAPTALQREKRERTARRCWRCGEQGHVCAQCPLAAGQADGGGLAAGTPADSPAAGPADLDAAATAAAAAATEQRKKLTTEKEAVAKMNLSEEVRRAAVQDLDRQLAELPQDPPTPTAPPEVRFRNAQKAVKKATAELGAARDRSKAATTALEAAQEVARAADLAAQAAEEARTKAEADLTAAKRGLASELPAGHSVLHKVLGGLADTAKRFGADNAEEATTEEYEAYCGATLAAGKEPAGQTQWMLTSFMQVLTREIGHVRSQVEAVKPPDPLAAGRDPYLASDDMDDDGEGAQTAKRKRLFGDGRDPAGAWGPPGLN